MAFAAWFGMFRGRARAALLFAAVLVASLAPASSAIAQITVDSGRILYIAGGQWGPGTSSCASCHFGNAPANTAQGLGAGSAHPFAANNAALITSAFGVGGVMTGYMVATARPVHTVSAADAYKLSLYIGQYQAPIPGNGTIATRTGASRALNVYALLPTDGSSGVAQDTGGVTVATSTQGVTPTVNVTSPLTGSIAYNLAYNPPANYVGSDSFTYRIINPASPGGVQASVSVTVYGITNNTLTATAVRGVNSANVFTVTSNDPGATFSSPNLPAGLSMSAAGVISGTPTVAGSFNVTLNAAINSAGANNGTVSRTLILSIAGFTNPSASTLNLFQNSATNLPFAVTAFPAPTAPAPYSVTPALPAGLALDPVTGVISGAPTGSGLFPVTLSANTPAGNVSQLLNISIGPVPVITTTPPISAAPQIYVAGTTGTAITSIQIDATNPPINAGSYIATGLAATGLTVNPATGQITGTPTSSGDFPVTLGATNVNGAGTLNVILRINSNVAPNVTSPATATTIPVGTANANVYTLTGTNGPYTAFAVVAPTTLPPGLALNPTTGVVSGTPTASGLFSTTFAVTNSGGLTSNKVVAFTINPTTAPVITSPTFASLAVGVAMTPIQVVATNPPILSYAVQTGSALPTGLVLDAVTGIISGTPTTPGPITTTLTATNVVNAGALAVPFTIGAPAPAGCTMNVPLNTATTLDLKPCMFPAFTPAGVSILATPAHGRVTVSGTSVTYTPVNNYFGNDSFSAVAYFAGNTTTAPGVVTVAIIGRPDPTQDPTVAAVVTAQADTAQRFSRAQISNFQRRMESLHQRSDAQGLGAPRLNAGSSLPTLSVLPSASASGDPSASVGNGQASVQTSGVPSTVVPRIAASSAFEAARDIGMAAAGQAPVAISQQQALDAVATGVGLKSLPFAETVTQLLTTNSINMANLVPSSGAPAPGATSFWVEGVVSFGNKDATGSSSAYDFSTSGVTFGADRRINDKLVLGLGLGYGRDKTNIGTDGSHNDGRGLSLAGYASYQPSPGTYIDGMLGIGSIDFVTRRYVVPINDFALGSRKGSQIFGSLTGGYEFRNNGVMFSPYLRLDYSAERLQDSTESGAGAYALTYFDQTSSSLQGTLGARGESIHSTSFGWAVPRVRAEFRHEFQSDRQGFISYADQIGGPRYGLATPGTGRDALVLGLGSDFIMRDGWTLGVDYQLTQTFGQASSFALQFKLSKDFDAKGLPKFAGGFSEEPSKPIDVQVDASYVFDDNVTRAKDGPDKMSDSSYSANVSKSEVFALSENARFVLNGSLGGERFQNFNGLSRISASVEGEYQYRESSDFSEPTFGLFGKVSVERYQSYLRNGYRTSLGASVRQPLTDRISLFGALSSNQRFGNSAVFNTSETALRLNADYSLSSRSTLYATGEFRYGDIVSTGRPSLENISVAKVFVQDDAYPGGQFFSYKLEGRTLLTTLGYNYGLGPRDSLDFSWRRVESTPSLRPSFVTSPQSYIDNQWSVTYLVRF